MTLEEAVKNAGNIRKLASSIGVEYFTVWRWVKKKNAPSKMAIELLKSKGIEL